MLKLEGLVAATYTPFDRNGDLNLSAIEPIVDDLIESGIEGLYVCGSTGEGMSLSSDERKDVAGGYVQAVAGQVPVVVQVGHNSLAESRSLARHAQQIGVDAISATCPSYFKVNDVATLVQCTLHSALLEINIYGFCIDATVRSVCQQHDQYSHAINFVEKSCSPLGAQPLARPVILI